MDRRKFIGLATSGIVAKQAFAAALPSPHTASTRPNFLFLIADDLMYRTIHSLNNPEIRTPNLDRLAKSGCAFTHCFHQGGWSGAVCVPSRTMLNSGLNTFHSETGIDNAHTWGQTLGAAGYDTYICGKWHLDPTVLQRSFKEMGPVGPGFLPSSGSSFYSDSGTSSDSPQTPFTKDPAYYRPRPGDTWSPSDRSLRGHWLQQNLIDIEKPESIAHSSVVYADHVIDHLETKAAKRDNPFFIYMGFNAPHDPRQSPQEFLDLYPPDKIEIPPNFLPEHPFKLEPAMLTGRDECLAPFPRTKEAVQLHRREYYSIITHMDQQIGRVLDALERSGKASNTYVILTADHGLAMGEHGLLGKTNMYDCAMRIPLLISGPGITAGKRVDELVYQHSMYATTCELAGIPVPPAVEFPSIAPLLHGEPHPIHDAVFCRFQQHQRAIRTKTHKLIVYPQAKVVQLFDIENDPWEMHDLSTDPAMSSLKAELMQTLKTRQKELGDPLDLHDPLNGVWNKPA